MKTFLACTLGLVIAVGFSQLNGTPEQSIENIVGQTIQAQSVPPQEQAVMARGEVSSFVEAVKSGVRIHLEPESGTVFFVEIPDANGITELVLVTAAHTFEKSKAIHGRLILRSGDQRKETGVRVRGREGNSLWKKHPTQDIAVLKMGATTSKEIYQSSVRIYDQKELADAKMFQANLVNVGADALIPCFPAKLESSKIGYPVLRKASVASYPVVAKKQSTFLLDYHAFGGDSGAPVIAEAVDVNQPARPGTPAELATRPYVIGMVIAQTRQTDKSVTPFEERVQHTPIGLGIAVNSIHLLETIEQLNE